MDIPFTHSSRVQGTSTRMPGDIPSHANRMLQAHLTRTPPGAGPRKKGLPIFALGKGTSVGSAVTPYPKRRRVLCTELLVPFLSVGGAIIYIYLTSILCSKN